MMKAASYTLNHFTISDAADASTWVRRNGRWVCALHTESLKGDPFGRDRRATASFSARD